MQITYKPSRVRSLRRHKKREKNLDFHRQMISKFSINKENFNERAKEKIKRSFPYICGTIVCCEMRYKIPFQEHPFSPFGQKKGEGWKDLFISFEEVFRCLAGWRAILFVRLLRLRILFQVTKLRTTVGLRFTVK